ncbi:nucleotide exchange factor GrpE [Patescibacteria group bacterium]
MSDVKDQKKEEKFLEMESNWKRALADYKNLEKRVVEEKSILVEFANSVLVEQLLPVLDNFEKLEEHTSDEGLKMCVKEYRNTLENAGLEEIKIGKGVKFDPEIMDAIETKKGKGNKVLEIKRKGYKFKGKLIRPISVVVAKGE